METHNCNASCLAPERKHKEAKQRATHLYNGFHKTMLAKEAHTMLIHMQNAALYQEELLCEPTRPLGTSDRLAWSVVLGSSLAVPITCATVACATKGKLYKGGFARFLERGGLREHVGVMHLFIRDATGEHVAIIETFSSAGDDTWDTSHPVPALVPFKMVTKVAAYMLDGHLARVLDSRF